MRMKRGDGYRVREGGDWRRSERKGEARERPPVS
jgi:hypothetical protein